MKKTLILIAAAILLAGSVVYAQETTPTPQNTQEIKDAKYTNDSIGHLSFVEGKAFVQRASDLGYEDAALNMPISEGDRIGTSEGRVEVHFGRGNYVRLDNDSKLDVLNLPKKDDDVARFRVWSGSAYLVVGSLKKEKAIELHTADSSFYVLDRGVYRVNVRENRDTEILVYQGLIEAAGEDGSTLLKAAQKLEISEGRFASKPSSFIAVADDSFDKFNASRTSLTGQEMAKNGRLPEELSDFEQELDENGQWTYLAPYGNVWVPNGVDADWRPYYNGRWTWLPLSGWTWWPYEPWGWSTFHYGRWHWGLDLGWYWIPMSMWGPAWVDWWWDDFYFGWAPLSYWGYPGVLFGGAYYGNYYGAYYPVGSRALTVVRRDHLKDPHIAANALRGDALKSLNKISLTSPTLSLRPTGTKISVEPLNGGRVMLRNDRTTGLSRDTRLSGGSTVGGMSGPRAIRKPEAPATGTQGKTTGTSVKSPSTGGKSTGSGRTTTTGGRNIRKKDPATSESSATAGTGTGSRVGSTRTVNGYPSSPSIKGPSSYGDGGAARARIYGGPATRSSGSSVGRSSSGRTGTTSRSGGSKVGSSGRSSGSSSRGSGSSSRGSSSRGSSGSRGGGGSVRRR